jgi:uncharacterized protein (DUF2235 family)
MPRNIIVCCDGTNNEFGLTNTNVVRLVQVLDDAAGQLVYYDPGVGTMPGPGFGTSVGKRASRYMDLGFATGLDGKVVQAYCYLMNTWEPGDRVFMFGFSRGAYSVRVLAGLLHAVGLLPPRSDSLVPYAMRLYGARRKARTDAQTRRYFAVLNAFQRTFARPVPGPKHSRRFPTHFLGVWDTVSSVGWVWEPTSFPHTRANDSIVSSRQAIALDERRCFFRQNRLAEGTPTRDAKERWFAGVHSDVGGGYADGGLWRAPFVWMVDEARQCGLAIDGRRKDALLRKATMPAELWAGPMHESLRGPWWLAEVIPKPSFRREFGRSVPAVGLGRTRHIDTPIAIHASAIERIWREPGYEARSLHRDFVSAVRSARPAALDLWYDPATPRTLLPA